MKYLKIFILSTLIITGFSPFFYSESGTENNTEPLSETNQTMDNGNTDGNAETPVSMTVPRLLNDPALTVRKAEFLRTYSNANAMIEQGFAEEGSNQIRRLKETMTELIIHDVFSGKDEIALQKQIIQSIGKVQTLYQTALLKKADYWEPEIFSYLKSDYQLMMSNYHSTNLQKAYLYSKMLNNDFASLISQAQITRTNLIHSVSNEKEALKETLDETGQYRFEDAEVKAVAEILIGTGRELVDKGSLIDPESMNLSPRKLRHYRNECSDTSKSLKRLIKKDSIVVREKAEAEKKKREQEKLRIEAEKLIEEAKKKREILRE